MKNHLATKLTKLANKRCSSAGSFQTSAAGAVTSLIITLLSGLLLYSSVYADNIPYSITYHDNVVSNMPTDVNDRTLSNTIPISSNTPLRSGFSFLGWCNTVPTDSDGTDTCDGIQYAAGSNYELDQTSRNNDLTLYAMWREPKTIASSTYMQEVTSCPDSITTGQAYTLKDSRDDTSYHVAKLADGKCWMLDNLAIDLVSVSLADLKGKTNASDTTLEYLKGSRTGTTSNKFATTSVANWSSGESYSAPLINTTSKDRKVTSYGAGDGYVGIYYNYCAASAGSYCYGNGYSSGTSSGNATEDVCPAGWHIPSGGSSGEFQALASNYGITTEVNISSSLQYNLSTPLSGYFNNGSTGDRGSYGYWWSSTRYDNSFMYYLGTTASAVTNRYDGARRVGYSIRCVLGS